MGQSVDFRRKKERRYAREKSRVPVLNIQAMRKRRGDRQLELRAFGGWRKKAEKRPHTRIQKGGAATTTTTTSETSTIID